MGYPFSDARYGSGLYSRRPDWWRDRACLNDAWKGKACDAPTWNTTTVTPAPLFWDSVTKGAPAWEPIVVEPAPMLPWEEVPIT